MPKYIHVYTSQVSYSHIFKAFFMCVLGGGRGERGKRWQVTIAVRFSCTSAVVNDPSLNTGSVQSSAVAVSARLDVEN